MGKSKDGELDKVKTSFEAFMDKLDSEIAELHRQKLGNQGCLISLTKLANGSWQTCLSFKGMPRLRLVRKGKTRVKAIQTTDKALVDLVTLLKNRGSKLPPPIPSADMN